MESAVWDPVPHRDASLLLLAKGVFATGASPVASIGGSQQLQQRGHEPVLVTILVCNLATVWRTELTAADLRATLQDVWEASTLSPSKLVALLSDSWIHRKDLVLDPPIELLKSDTPQLKVLLQLLHGKVNIHWPFVLWPVPALEAAELIKAQITLPLVKLYGAERASVGRLVPIVEDLELRLKDVHDLLAQDDHVNPDVFKRIKNKRRVYVRNDYVMADRVAERAAGASLHDMFAEESFKTLYRAYSSLSPSLSASSMSFPSAVSSSSSSSSQPPQLSLTPSEGILLSQGNSLGPAVPSSPSKGSSSVPLAPSSASADLAVPVAPTAAAPRVTTSVTALPPAAPARAAPLSEEELIAERKRKLDEELRRKEEEAAKKPKKKKDFR